MPYIFSDTVPVSNGGKKDGNHPKIDCKFAAVSDIIKLLPDSVANQIAAGEVVQRPASAVKELLENSLDAGASEIRLIIKDGGTSLIQVIDNGSGMTDTDARMCWERHATSKIESAQDIYALRTFGFRGEALASIAAVAQVELKTRRAESETATYIRIEGSTVLEQSYTSGTVGTSISIRNLFYNIPARRNFLKSIAVEAKHIMEEFQRQALAHPEVGFKFYNNDVETFNLIPGTLEERMKEVLGLKKELLEVSEQTEIIGIEGFIGVPETARKTRGDQFFYVNGRFIRSAYFNHAVQGAFAGTIEDGAFPMFVLNLNIDPSKVDVNVHPTKTEVKFEDERHIYNILKAAVRKALGMHIAQPDAELFGSGGLEGLLSTQQHQSWNLPDPQKQNSGVPGYNPFGATPKARMGHQDWARILGPVDDVSEIGDFRHQHSESLLPKEGIKIQEVFLLRNQYLFAKINEELFIIDPNTAREKVNFHTFRQRLEKQKGSSQQLLFPRTADLNPAKLQLFLELQDEFKALGFDVSHFGGHSVIINGLPPEIGDADETSVIEKMLEAYEQSETELKTGKHDRLAYSLARQSVNRRVQFNDKSMMESLIESMFALPDALLPYRNKAVAMKIGTDFIQELFKKQ